MIRKARSSMATCGIVTLMTALHASAIEQSTLTELLNSLNLSGYSSSMSPPEFRGESSDGKMLSLTDLWGKVVVLNFWATWCLECRPEMPMFEQLHREFSDRGFTVIGINAREGTARVRQYAKELGLTFPLILDPSGKIISAYGVIGLPSTFLIGRNGRAVALAIGPRDWSGKPGRALIQTLLVESAALKGSPMIGLTNPPNVLARADRVIR